MGGLVWEEKYAVGIEEIDRQHQQLIQMINDLHAALLEERGQQVLAEIVRRMLDYAAYHFSSEERLLKDNGYLHYGEHKREHDLFTAKADELRQRVEAKRFVLSFEVLQFLRSWLMNHILVNDKKYAPFLLGVGMR